LIFSALMALYSSNIRRLFITDIDWMHQNLLSALNVFTIALLLCTYTGRFVYPLLSLEGRKFWVLGLLPLEREQLLWGKFAFATTMVFGIAETLVVLSDLMLLMPVSIILLHALMVGVLAFGLSGLSVGLGALLSNFRETDPSKIAAGFGGTLNVVASLFFLIATYGLMALPWHLLSAGGAEGPEPLSLPAVGVVTAGVCGGLMVGFAAVVGPMSAGAQAFRRMEF
jgi:ABC-2 type transport system permease protein